MWNITHILTDLSRILIPILAFNTTVVARIDKEDAVLLSVDPGWYVVYVHVSVIVYCIRLCS